MIIYINYLIGCDGINVQINKCWGSTSRQRGWQNSNARDFYVSISHIESHENIADPTDDKGQRKREAMSNLRQATVKSIFDALPSS